MSSTGKKTRWPRKQLREIAAVQTGVAKNSGVMGDVVEQPYLRVANVQDGYLDLSEVKSILVRAESVKRHLLQYGDVLFTEGGDFDKLGRGCVWRNEIPGCVHQNHVFAVRTDATKLLPEYLAAYAESNHGKAYFLWCSKKSTNLASINTTQLRDLPIPLPPLPIQRGMIAIRALFDRLKNLHDASIRCLLVRRAHVVRTLLRERQCTKDDQCDSWEEFKLGELFVERSESGRVDLPLLSVTATSGIVPRDSLNRKDTSNNDKSRYKHLRVGDIAYNTMRMWQGVSALSDREGIVSPAYTIVKPEKKILPQYAAYLLKEPRVVHDLYRYSQGLVDDTRNLKYRHFAEVRVRIPCKDVQSQVVEVLTLIDDEIRSLRELRNATERRKKGVMERLLSGETVIPNHIVKQLNVEAEEPEKARAKAEKNATKRGSKS